MAKMIFVQDVAFEAFGVEYLSAYVKSKGHTVDLIILNQEKNNFNPVAYLADQKPDVVGFSITTIDHQWSTALAKKIRQEERLAGTLVIFGGAHPTMSPSMIEDDGVDMICVGEGEYALAELLDHIDKGVRDHSTIKNIYVKKDGHVFKNELRPLIENYDLLPFPDRDIYFKYPILRDMTTKKFFSARGCPYHCTYCNNHYYQKLFAGLGKYVVYRRPEHVIEEIKYVRQKYGFKHVYLAAETVTTNHPWLKKFLELYKKEIAVPFSCLSRVNELDEDIIKNLADAGCYFTSFGLESGSDRLRNGLLKRGMSREKLLEVAALLHKYKIKFLVHQIFALPTETIEEAFETVHMCVRMKADSTWSTIFQPYKGTEIYQYCKTNNLLVSEEVSENVNSLYAQSTLKQPHIKEISNLQKLVLICLKCPVAIPLIRAAIKLPNNIFFEFISKINMLISFRLRYRLGYVEMLGMYLRSKKRFG